MGLCIQVDYSDRFEVDTVSAQHPSYHSQVGVGAEGHIVARPETRNCQVHQIYGVSSIGSAGRDISLFAALRALCRSISMRVTRDPCDQLRPDLYKCLYLVVVEVDTGGKQRFDVPAYTQNST